MSTEDIIKQTAKDLGFDEVGICSLSSLDGAVNYMQDWIQEGRHGTMRYLEDYDQRNKDFLSKFSDARSVIVLGVNYFTLSQGDVGEEEGVLNGRVARYAWGQDYHEVIGDKLNEFISILKDGLDIPFRAETCVDTQPLPERYAAIQAGLGFGGKNTMLLSRSYGPWLFLSEIVTNLDLKVDSFDEGHCGTCVSCQEICPTGALDKDYQMDARRCIAYLTIEHKGVIPRELRPQIKNWVFGCDECLDVCPFTSHQKETSWEALQPQSGVGERLRFDELFELSSNRQYEEKMRGTPLLRANRKQMLRNACIVLGNLKDPRAFPYLERALLDQAPLVRLHAAWALGEIGTSEAIELLKKRQGEELDDGVVEEISMALSEN